MQIALPKDHDARKRACDWLGRSGIPHLKLFQTVEIADGDQATRFRNYLTDDAGRAVATAKLDPKVDGSEAKPSTTREPEATRGAGTASALRAFFERPGRPGR